MKKLSSFYEKNKRVDSIENILGSNQEDVLIDAGFYLEGYSNPDGVFNEGAHSNGCSLFLCVDVEIGFKEIHQFFMGELIDQTLTISIIPSEEVLHEQERVFCKENLLSEMLIEASNYSDMDILVQRHSLE